MNGTLWLAIDTATDVASVALGAGVAVRAQESTRGARRHAAEIVPLIDRVLKAGGCRAADLAGVVVADGPGSFTGLRIGWAAAKALVQAADLPLQTIPSLMAAAAALAGDGETGPVAACYDALRGQVYGAVYRFHADAVETLIAPGVFTLDELAQRTTARPRVVSTESLELNALQLLSLMNRAGLRAPCRPR